MPCTARSLIASEKIARSSAASAVSVAQRRSAFHQNSTHGLAVNIEPLADAL
jgi:hypothetical protein